MVYAMLYAENADIVATYESHETALRDLTMLVTEHPDLQDEIGLRAYEDGRPIEPFQPASQLVSEQRVQEHPV